MNILLDGVRSDYNHARRSYQLVLAVCACVMFIILSLAALVTSICVYRQWKLHKSKQN